jgi:hypothetical protein
MGTPQLGKAGWGTFYNWSGMNTLSEAFYLANENVAETLNEMNPDLLTLANDTKLGKAEHNIKLALALGKVKPERRKEAEALFDDLDTLVFYGDPQWEARRLNGRQNDLADWQPVKGGWQLNLHPGATVKQTAKWKFVLPDRMPRREVAADNNLQVQVTDNLLTIIPNQPMEPGKTYAVTIKAPTATKAGG